MLLLLLLISGVYFPVLTGSEVIFPHDNRQELGLEPSFLSNSGPIQNRKFSDQSSVYVPATHWHLNGNTSTWISLWNPNVEVGRPTIHLSGISKAWPLMTVAGLFSDDAFRVYSALSVLAIYLTGIFLYLFLMELGLRPIACLAGSVFLALGITLTYWVTFTTFIWTRCWSAALLLAVTRMLKKFSWSRGLFLSFCVYAIMLTAYPQAVVYTIYLLVIVAAAGLIENRRNGMPVLLPLVGIFAFGFFGIGCAAPVYFDVYLHTQDSPRTSIDSSYFLSVLPQLDSVSNYIAYFGKLVDAYIHGNPIRSDYANPFDGLSLSPLFAVLIGAGIMDWRDRRTRIWVFFAGTCLLATLWEPLYLFGVNYMGLSLSRGVPIGGALIPFAVIAAYAVDRAVTGAETGSTPPRGAIAAVVLVAILILADVYVVDAAVDFRYLFLSALFLAGSFYFLTHASERALVFLLVLFVSFYSAPLVLSRAPSDIAMDSPRVQRIKSLTANGGRYASVGALSALTPNQDSLLGLRSIHSYNSLSTQYYQRWAATLDPHTPKGYRKRFTMITSISNASRKTLCDANVTLLVSTQTLDFEFLTLVDDYEGRYFYRTDCDQLGLITAYRVESDDPQRRGTEVHLRVDRQFDDLFELTVEEPERDRLLVVRHQYHPAWKAYGDDMRLETHRVDELYLGVFVPEGVSSVKLVFRPYVWWAWVPQVFFAIVLIVFGARWGYRRRFSRTG